MELKHKVFVGINSLEELCEDRESYFEKEYIQSRQGSNQYLKGLSLGSKDAWHYIGDTLKEKGEGDIHIFLAENYKSALEASKQTGLDENSAGYIDGGKNVYQAALRDIGRDDLINMVEDGSFDPNLVESASDRLMQETLMGRL